MRNGRRHALDRCAEQSYWRQTRSACEDAFEQLESAELIEPVDEEYQQTARGSAYFAAAEEVSNQRLYQPWSVLSLAEYAAYKEALAVANEILEEDGR